MDRADLAAREFESATAWWWNGDAEKSESQKRKDLKQQDAWCRGTICHVRQNGDASGGMLGFGHVGPRGR